jgi:gamma-glutamyltranspeptidase/glutathione hydrolase
VCDVPSGTAYVCAVDGDRLAVSFIQSLYHGFGSKVCVPGTGIVLQNRAAAFHLSGAVEPGRRPYHTVIPGLLVTPEDNLVGVFGVVGGMFQAQGHVQLISALVDRGADPQAAIDGPRFRIIGRAIHLEPGLWKRAREIRRWGYPVICDDQPTYCSGHAIVLDDDRLIGGADSRMDGIALGY